MEFVKLPRCLDEIRDRYPKAEGDGAPRRAVAAVAVAVAGSGNFGHSLRQLP